MRGALGAMVLAVTAATAAPAMAQDDEELFDEIVVYGDLFARWDDTRWLVETELAVPIPLTFARDQNLEIRATAMQVRAIIGCNKDAQLRKKRWEVVCEVEDVALKVVPFRNDRGRKKLEDGATVLQEIDAKLTGAVLQLQVADDGRVTNLDLEGVPKNNRRMSEIHETLRQVMSRVVVGFDLKLRKYNQLNEGKWTEFNSALMTMPLPPSITGVAGSSMLVHYLNKYQGQVLVQSIGKGGVNVPWGEMQLNFTTELIGVSIFDPEEGYMTERVWSLTGTSNASNLFSKGSYAHAGRIRMLGAKEAPNLGSTELVNGPDEEDRGLGTWVPIES